MVVPLVLDMVMTPLRDCGGASSSESRICWLYAHMDSITVSGAQVCTFQACIARL